MGDSQHRGAYGRALRRGAIPMVGSLRPSRGLMPCRRGAAARTSRQLIALVQGAWQDGGILSRHEEIAAMPPIEVKPCQNCGKQFMGRMNVQRFCSGACAMAARRTPPKVCAQCGEEFRRSASRVRFCSRECFFDSRRRAPMLPVACGSCGETFDPRKPGQKYCSRVCQRRRSGGGPKPPKPPKPPRERAVRLCPQCGTAPRKGDAKYCGQDCRDDARAKPLRELSCQGCGRTFWRREQRDCCSVRCAQLYKGWKLRAPFVAKYLESPKLCPCGEPIPYEKRHKAKFCSPPKECCTEFRLRGTFRSGGGLDMAPSRQIARRPPVESEEDLQQARRMFVEKGYGLSQIADALGRSEPSVRRAVEGLVRGKRQWSPGQEWEIAAARRLRGEGVPPAEIARQLKRSLTTVLNWVSDVRAASDEFASVAARRKSQERQKRVLARSEQDELQALIDEQQAEQVVELYQAGESINRISVEIGRSTEWVRGRLVAEGIPLRHSLSRGSVGG